MSTNPINSWPTDEEDIWLNPYFFLPNWSSSIKIQSRWSNDVSLNRNAGEVRVGLVDRPYRLITAKYLGMSRTQSLQYQMMTAKMGKARFWFPLYCDISLLTVQADSTIVTTTTSEPITIYCDTSNRRFIAGKYVVIVSVDKSSKAMTPYFDILRIISVGVGSLVLAGTLNRDYSIKSRVYPLVIGKVIPSESKNSITDQIVDGEITVEEVIGKTALSTSATANSITTDYSATVSPVGDQYPILDVRPDWKNTEHNWYRENSVDVSGRGKVVQTFGDRPLLMNERSYTFLNREDAYDFIRFFDSRCGRLYPFYILSELNEYSNIYGISVDRKQISIEYTGPKINWAFRPYVGIRLKDGTHIVRKVIDVLATSTTTIEPLTTTADPGVQIENIRFETALPAFNLSDVHRLHVSYLVRFDTDELEENWITDSIMECTVSFKELDEKDIEYDILFYGTSTTAEPSTTTSGTTIEPIFEGYFTDYAEFYEFEDLYVRDQNKPEPAGYWVGALMIVTSGAAVGSYGIVTEWHGQYEEGWEGWYKIGDEENPPVPLLLWEVEPNDTYVLTFVPGWVTVWEVDGSYGYVYDIMLDDPAGTWNGGALTITTGPSAGLYALIVDWSGPPECKFTLTSYSPPYPPDPKTWTVNPGDHYILWPPPE